MLSSSRSTPRLVLASTSSARRALFDQVGLQYEAVSPQVDEPLTDALPSAEQARALALAKAQAVFARFPDAIVVGADQVLSFEGRTWSKAADEAEAREQLALLSGRMHTLLSAFAVLAPGEPPVVEHAETRLWVRALSPEEQAAYLATGEWHGCAGGYRLEGRGLALFERIEGADHTNILGLPMPPLLTHLRRLGVPLFG